MKLSLRSARATFSLILAAFISTSVYGAGWGWGDSPDEERAEIREQRDAILASLYKTQPGASQAVESAVGYATFSNFGMKIFFAGGGTGTGMAVDNESKAETFMNMVEVQAGLGLGVKKFRLVFVFETRSSFNNFVNSGWEIGAQATAAAKTGSDGAALAGAVSVQPGVWLYQMTQDGLALELTAKGTKYYKDSDLN